MNKRVNATKGKPCSCPDHKVCTACYARKLKPRIHVQQPRNPSIPIKVERFTERQGKIVKLRGSLSSLVRKPVKEESSSRRWSRESLRSWYRGHRDSRDQKVQEEEREKERKAYLKEIEELRKVQKKYEKEQQEEEKRKEWEQRRLTLERLESAKIEELKRLQREREKEVLEQLKEQEKYLKSYTPQLRAETNNTYNDNNGKKNKTADSNNHRISWKERFSHWFYRACCQFYCYLTCVLTVLFVLIFVI